MAVAVAHVILFINIIIAGVIIVGVIDGDVGVI